MPPRAAPDDWKPDDDFAPEERLFRRLRSRDINEGVVDSAAIDLPKCSFNRERYSTPNSVIDPSRFPEFTFVGSLRVSDLPAPVQADEGKSWEFFIQHDPIRDENNYAHTEIRTRSVGEIDRSGKKPGSSKVKKEMRERLAEQIMVLDAATPPSATPA